MLLKIILGLVTVWVLYKIIKFIAKKIILIAIILVVVYGISMAQTPVVQYDTDLISVIKTNK